MVVVSMVPLALVIVALVAPVDAPLVDVLALAVNAA
jgi:hypothetical protein